MALDEQTNMFNKICIFSWLPFWQLLNVESLHIICLAFFGFIDEKAKGESYDDMPREIRNLER